MVHALENSLEYFLASMQMNVNNSLWPSKHPHNTCKLNEPVTKRHFTRKKSKYIPLRIIRTNYFTKVEPFWEAWWPISEQHMGGSGTCDSFSEFNRTKVSPRKQSSRWGCKVLLAKGLGWQHHSSTKALQFSLGKGRTLRNFLRGKKKRYFNILYSFIRC